MPSTPEWSTIGLRLACTILAGALIGFNRTSHGRVAGLRTTILVSLAACVSMIQVNLLLTIAGKPPDSYVVLDLMRLPLGILSGMGFIGAGAILKRDDMVVGVTTAATLWFVTVIGLCFGAGQMALGFMGLTLGMVILGGLNRVEVRMKQDRQAVLTIETEPSGPEESEIRGCLQAAGFQVASCAVDWNASEQHSELSCTVRWRAQAVDSELPGIIRELVSRPGVVRIVWKPQVR